MKKYIFISIIFVILSIGFFLSHKKPYKITILDERFLLYPDKNSIQFGGISDIAYDNEKHQLYLIGDRSIFFKFEAKFDEKIESLNYLLAHKILRDENNKEIYTLATYDSEGLTTAPNGNVLIAHEQIAGLLEVSPNGEIIHSLKVPKKLEKKKNYRNGNKMLESIAYHKRHGILIASEYPLKQDNMQKQTIYSLDGKREWHFRAEKHENCGVTAIEVMDDGNLMVLERSYCGILKPLRVILKKLYLNDCDKENNCRVEYLASFNSLKGDGFNNFEGLTRVSKNRYLMVSDNNDYTLLPTKLIYFEVDGA